MAPRRSDRIALRSFRSVPAFLRLPREIRDYIYEMLVTTPWTFDYVDGRTGFCPYRPIFDQSPAILLVNKQISEEARRIFYTKYEFVVLKLLGSRAQDMEEYIGDPLHMPQFNILHNRELVDPVLTVTIQSLLGEKDDVHVEEEKFTLITTTEAIHSIIEQFWCYVGEGEPHFDETLHLSLHFRNKNPSRRLYLQEHVLQLWDQIQGFKKVSLTGDFDHGLARHLEEYMMMGPLPCDIDRYMDLYKRIAEDHQKQKFHCQAGWFWSHIQGYWQYHSYNDTHSFTGRPRNLFKHDLKTNLVAAQPILMKSMLEQMKSLLYLPNYRNALMQVGEANDWLKDDRYVDNYRLDPRGMSVAKAQIRLCGCLASIGANRTSNYCVKDLKAAVKAFIEGNAQPQNGQKDVYKNVHDKLCWAIDNYFIDLDSPLRYTQKKWLNSRNHTDKEVPREGWPTFCEWMNVPVWPE